MKTNILLVIIFFIYHNSIAQNSNICGKLYYTQTVNIGFSKIENTDYLMTFNDKESYSEEINIKSSTSSTETKEDVGYGGNLQRKKLNVMARTNLTPKFFYNSQNDFYYLTILANEDILIKEDKHKWNWNLHPETKKIGKFLCQRATINFRGRSYTAWFTNDIPVSFGPWKFQGLSGLILEVYSTNKSFHAQATKIEINSDDSCIMDIDKKQLESALTVTEFGEKKKEIFNNISTKMRSRIPKGYKLKKTGKDCEDCPKEIENFEEKE